MSIRIFVPPLLPAVAIAIAPLSEAAPTGPTCTETGTATICQTDGHAQVTTTHPPVNFQQQYPYFGPYPHGLLFHHGHRR